MSRTIQTLNYIADVLDCHFIPVTKSWRLNEKHYGQLQVMRENYGRGRIVRKLSSSMDRHKSNYGGEATMLLHLRLS